MVGDVFVYSEAHVVTASISRFAGPTQFFEGAAYRGRVCIRALVYVSICVCNCVSQKKESNKNLIKH